jgi:hypothetical protein
MTATSCQKKLALGIQAQSDFLPPRLRIQGGNMRFRTRLVVLLLAFGVVLVSVGVLARAQDKTHVISLGELNQESVRKVETRASDESAVRELLSSERGRKALQSAHIEYKKVDKAVSQLNDEELAKLALRSRKAQADFAAGRISNTLIVVIVAAVAALIILAVSLPRD